MWWQAGGKERSRSAEAQKPCCRSKKCNIKVRTNTERQQKHVEGPVALVVKQPAQQRRRATRINVQVARSSGSHAGGGSAEMKSAFGEIRDDDRASVY